jgi:hypothetical protein
MFVPAKKLYGNYFIDLPFFQVAVDSAEPVEGGGSRGGSYMEPPGPYGAYGPMLSYGQFSGSLGYDVSRHQCESCFCFFCFAYIYEVE